MAYKDKETRREYNQRYYKKNRSEIIRKHGEYQKLNSEAHALWKRRHDLKLKKIVLTHYGGGKLACVRCGYSDIRALTIDHINSEGNKHRKKIKTWNFYYWLKTENYPLGYQTLCMNCQFIKKRENNEYYNIHYLIPQFCGV